MAESPLTTAATPAPDLSRLADIELPPVADWAVYEWAAVGVGLALMLALAGGLIGYGIGHVIGQRLRSRARPAGVLVADASHVHEALTRLDALAAAWEAGQIDEREATYRLVTLLRLGLGLTQLPVMAPQGIPEAAWQGLLERCALRYRPGAAGLGAPMFNQARAWLATRT